MVNLQINYEEENNLITARAEGDLEKEDFKNKIEPAVMQILVDYPSAKGVLIDATEFKGWDGLADIKQHFDFLKKNEKAFDKIAIVGESYWKQILPVVGFFIKSEVKIYDKNEMTEARNWASNNQLVNS